MFRKARSAGQRPYWLGDDVWNQLLAHWNSPSYRNKCVTAKRIKASPKGGSLHAISLPLIRCNLYGKNILS